MSDQLSLALGADVFSRERHLRLTNAKTDFYSEPLLEPGAAAHAREAIDRLVAEAGER
jgi:hypothetical protein